MTVETRRFTGFRPEAIDFLADLAQNNERAWFQARKAEYEHLLKEPMEDFVAALADAFAARRLPFQADPKRSIFRIYRDTRFAKDKSPHQSKDVTGASGHRGMALDQVSAPLARSLTVQLVAARRHVRQGSAVRHDPKSDTPGSMRDQWEPWPMCAWSVDQS